MAKIIVADDEKPIQNLIIKNLELSGHYCIGASDGQEVLELIENGSYDLIILDIMMPKLSGFEVLERIKDTPTILVSAKKKLDDRLKGLSLGADDYITKPFAIQELLLRVNAILKRTLKSERKLEFDNISIDFVAKKVFLRGNEVYLTPKEFDLLETLVTNRNVALSRDKLVSIVWGYDYEGFSRTVDVHIRQIRTKLELHDRIKTIFKTGYRFEL